MSRRASLASLGGLVAGAAGLAGLRASEEAGAGPAESPPGSSPASSPPSRPRARTTSDDASVRRNMTEGRPGAPLTLRLTVVNASSCKPIKGAAVEIWHCDAGGVYSATGAEADERFLRGIQRTDAKGLALFQTLYPGWYQGRTVHIHTMVHLGGNVVHTGQLYFPDSVSDVVYQAEPVQPASQQDDAQRRRQHLPEWWKAFDVEAREERDGVRRLDHDGSAAVVEPPLHAPFTQTQPSLLSYEPLSRERRDFA